MGLVVIEAIMWLLKKGVFCITMSDKLCYIHKQVSNYLTRDIILLATCFSEAFIAITMILYIYVYIASYILI